MNIAKMQNSINFGMLKISTDSATKEAIHRYVNSMDKARVLGDTFTRINDETGDEQIVITGKNLHERIMLEAKNGLDDKPAAKIELAINEEIDEEKTKEFSQQIIDSVNN